MTQRGTTLNSLDTHGSALNVDLYELTMAAGYLHNKVDATAVFELSCHTMPENRNFLVACGLEQIVEFILNLRFSEDDIAYLQGLPVFQKTDKAFFDYLRGFKFSGDVWAMAEGEFFFAREPILQVEAPIVEAQILETYLLSVTNIESSVATKAARVVHAAACDGIARGVVDFGSRRAHGPQAAVLAARAAYAAGCRGTSNVYAGGRFGIPVYGTIAHSWVEAFDSEEEAFEKYYQAFPENSIFLVDTYDTLDCVDKMLRFPWKEKIKGVRLDSGDLAALAKAVRKKLDSANLKDVKILASGNLNEHKIEELVKAKAPIDVFGVGTDMVTSRDYPALDLTYKLVQTRTQNGKVHLKAKFSPEKETVPGKKQVFRCYDAGGFLKEDTIGLADEAAPLSSKPLLKQIIRDGKLIKALPSLENIREYLSGNIMKMPASYLDIHKKNSPVCGYTQALRGVHARKK